MSGGHRRGGVSRLGAAVLVLLAGAAASPQTPLQHEVTVTLKLIQVFVTGPDGKPALDLSKSDFILTDNGKPQTVTDFESHILAAPAAERAVAVALPAPAPTPAGPAPLLSRKFIFLIDYVDNGFEGVGKAKAAAREFLDTKVGPDDEVGLFSLSTSSGLTLHQYLTKDHDKVRSALKKLRDIPGGGGGVAAGGELIGMELLNADVMGPHTRKGDHAGPSSRDLFEEIAAWAKSLRTIPGRKNIILFTRGFGNGVVRPGSLNNLLFETMARELAAANAPVFTVDTSPQVAPTGTGPGPSMTLTEGSLDYLAKATGGKFMGHVNYSSRVASGIQDATANYYVLGYYVPAAWDGKYHEVKVEVRKPGYTVHAQRGYFNPVPFAKLTAIEKHLQLLEIVLGETPSARQTPAFPLAALQFPGAGGPATLLLSELPEVLREAVGEPAEFVSLVLNDSSAIVDGKRAEIEWTGLRTGLVYQYGTAALAPGRYECRAVLRNLDDGRAAVGACVIEVPALSPDAPSMSSPLLLIHGTGANYLNLAAPAKKGGEADGLSISEIFPFPANEYVPLVGALETGATSVFAEIVCVWKKERAGGKDLSATLRPDGGGEDVLLTTNLISAFSRDDRDLYILGLEFPALAAGRYRLEITAEDQASGSVLRATSLLSVR
jgi:VWFA-related protein